MNKEKTLTVTFDEARDWYIKGGELKELALRCFSEEDLLKDSLPKTLEECFRIYMESHEGEYINDESQVSPVGKPMLALMRLLICREVYRNGWKPNWMSDSDKYIIECNSGDIIQNISKRCSKILSFQSEQARDEFIRNFRDLILDAKELI